MGTERIELTWYPWKFQVANMGGVSLPVECLDGQAYEPLTVHPWLAVVAITMIPIRKRTTNARWARSRGKRILNIYSGRILAGERSVRPQP